jgi:hypothetical protein
LGSHTERGITELKALGERRGSVVSCPATELSAPASVQARTSKGREGSLSVRMLWFTTADAYSRMALDLTPPPITSKAFVLLICAQ